jgi:hypothetical protein
VLRGETLRLFQYDGAIAHNANTTALLQEFFGENTVGRGLWPPRSPDLTQLDFFLQGFLKENVYWNNPRSLKELKHNTEQTVANTDTKNFEAARNTQRGCILVFEKVVDIFSICCFLTNKNKRTTPSSCYIDVTKVYKYCCSLGYVLNETSCTAKNFRLLTQMMGTC